MASTRTCGNPAQTKPSKRTLQRLRREAGYHSAKEFAKKLGIPESTYARYERQPEGPDTGVPLSSAWRIADELGCSIDLVVGREDIDAPKPKGIASVYEDLSRSSRELLDEYLRYLVYRDEAVWSQDWR